ncbi:MAG: heme-binding protein [Gammaproteobacteria bacterium]|nr:heme-binding protein [Gammaproteobacteria bacterium]
MRSGSTSGGSDRRHAWVLGVLLTMGLFATMANAIEEPEYRVLQRYAGFEVREYPPYLVAEVRLPGPPNRAGNQGFRILAAYIFGKNRGERRIAMAAPVTQVSVSTKIPMAAPVMQSEAQGEYLIQFTIPREYTLATVPEPTDPRIRLEQMPATRYAVIRYSGTWTDRNYRQHLDALRRDLLAAGLKSVGKPIYARYNAPFVPWFMRRNEIWLKLP